MASRRRIVRPGPSVLAAVVTAVLAACSVSGGSASVESARPAGVSTTALRIPSSATPAPTPTTPGVTTAPVPASAAPAPTTAAPASTTVAPAPAPTTARPAATTPAPATGIAGIDFENFTYPVGEGAPVTVAQGAAQRGNAGDPGYIFVRVEDVLKGDMDGDGQPEAAVTLLYNTGGTGQFTDVLVYRWDGSAPALVGAAGVGDRAFDGVRSTTIEGGQLVIDRYGGADGACCPTTVVRRTYTVGAGGVATTGAARTWAIVYLDRDPVATQVPIRFRPGTNGAYLSGLADQSVPGTFAASKGQRLTLAVEELNPVLEYASLDLVKNGDVLGTAAPDAPLSIVLPEGGGYLVQVHGDGGGAGAGTPLRAVEAVLSIG